MLAGRSQGSRYAELPRVEVRENGRQKITASPEVIMAADCTATAEISSATSFVRGE